MQQGPQVSQTLGALIILPDELVRLNQHQSLKLAWHRLAALSDILEGFLDDLLFLHQEHLINEVFLQEQVEFGKPVQFGALHLDELASQLFEQWTRLLLGDTLAPNCEVLLLRRLCRGSALRCRSPLRLALRALLLHSKGETLHVLRIVLAFDHVHFVRVSERDLGG